VLITAGRNRLKHLLTILKGNSPQVEVSVRDEFKQWLKDNGIKQSQASLWLGKNKNYLSASVFFNGSTKTVAEVQRIFNEVKRIKAENDSKGKSVLQEIIENNQPKKVEIVSDVKYLVINWDKRAISFELTEGQAKISAYNAMEQSEFQDEVKVVRV
jgi:hypothetical protein